MEILATEVIKVKVTEADSSDYRHTGDQIWISEGWTVVKASFGLMLLPIDNCFGWLNPIRG